MVAQDSSVVVDAADVADIAAAALASQQQQQQELPRPPGPLPEGWVLKESRSQPNYYFYYHQVTGVSSWQPPVSENSRKEALRVDDAHNAVVEKDEQRDAVVKSRKKEQRLAEEPSKKRIVKAETHHDNKKRLKTATKPKQVRILHILKKHKDSRKPSSWRNPNITITKQEAKAELQGLMELLEEVKSDPAELRATVEELARTESDCSSAKRGGDLGFFGPKKMQPAFEEAAFALDIGQLSGIVETSSGVHVLLRIG